ncbi:MAG TPA: hypothetical protein VH208_01025 [Myxococcaceae bacterium]|jgi:hypothetical protein|nr:hypothetical protein [Myxococcaceae bacterium]
MAVTCFLIEPAGSVRWGLRRHSESGSPSPCPRSPGKWGYHGAVALVGEEPAILDEGGHILNGARDIPPADDPRWPTRCACGYVFRPEDPLQKWVEGLYRRADTGQVITLREAPPGAMWDAHWLPRAADGRSLCVRLPGGQEWWIDGPASNGAGWTRTGEPPVLTVTPSILTDRYHGWLRAGVLSDPL